MTGGWLGRSRIARSQPLRTFDPMTTNPFPTCRCRNPARPGRKTCAVCGSIDTAKVKRSTGYKRDRDEVAARREGRLEEFQRQQELAANAGAMAAELERLRAATPVWFDEIAPLRPPTYVPVIVFGVLDTETSPDSHEGYWSGKRWESIRTADDRNIKILEASHWMFMPKPTP